MFVLYWFVLIIKTSFNTILLIIKRIKFLIEYKLINLFTQLERKRNLFLLPIMIIIIMILIRKKQMLKPPLIVLFVADPGVYTCQTCNALFTCLEYYQQHRRHHAECNGIKLLTCNYCPYSTDNSFHYNWHIMSHAGEQQHRCQVCNKPSLNTASTSPMKQESIGLDTSCSISDDDPSSCAMAGKRFIHTL